MLHVTLMSPMGIKLMDKRVLIMAFDAEGGELEDLNRVPQVVVWRATMLYGQGAPIKQRISLAVSLANVAGYVAYPDKPDGKPESKP
jgi:hypothetical protein